MLHSTFRTFRKTHGRVARPLRWSQPSCCARTFFWWKKTASKPAENDDLKLSSLFDLQLSLLVNRQIDLLESIDEKFNKMLQQQQEIVENSKALLEHSQQSNPIPPTHVAKQMQKVTWSFQNSPAAEIVNKVSREFHENSSDTMSESTSLMLRQGAAGERNLEKPNATIDGDHRFPKKIRPPKKMKLPSPHLPVYGSLKGGTKLVAASLDILKEANISSVDDIVTTSTPPQWSCRSTSSMRDFMPILMADGKPHLERKSGCYYQFTVKYNSNSDTSIVGVVIGEIAFTSDGYATAEGADWDGLMSGHKQTRLPYSYKQRGEPVWMSRKLSEPWKSGDTLTLGIDTANGNIYYERSGMKKKIFKNILTFTNDRDFPDYIQVFAFVCSLDGPESARLSLVEKKNKAINRPSKK